MSENVVIDGGRRVGRTLSAEPAFRSAIAESKNVYMKRNGVWFCVTLGADDQIVYTALERRPEDLPVI
jgi:shikimate kinase